MTLTRGVPVVAVIGLLACATTADVLQLDHSVRPKTSPPSIRLKEAAKLGGHAVLLDNGSLTRVGGDKVIVFTDSTRSN